MADQPSLQATTSSLSSDKILFKPYKCEHAGCDACFTRIWNAQRHYRDCHLNPKPKAQFYTPNHPAAASLSDAFIQTRTGRTTPPFTDERSTLDRSHQPEEPSSDPLVESAAAAQSICDEAREPSRAVTTRHESHPVLQPSPEPSIDPPGLPAPEQSRIGPPSPGGERPSSASDEPLDDGFSLGVAQRDTSRKRKGSILVYDRIADSRRRDSMPTYVVKRSRKHLGQQQALDWLKAYGKDRFDEKLAALLSQWGVKETHEGTCVLCPQAWSSLEPIHIMDLFDADKCPAAGSGRLTYQYSDHATAFVRAKVWFQDGHWPRKGVELDNFLGAGPFKPMDASHLCHHDDCIIHATYEPAYINHDRRNCSIEAQSLRQQGLSVAERCDKHDPPCLMQHASLSTLETYCIQFSTLCKAKGIPPKTFASRPRRHRYPTFESQLPLSRGFSAVVSDPEHLSSQASPANKEGRPDFICAFCTRIKSFTSAIGYWSHLFHKHEDSEEEERLKEIRRTATVWRVYWDRYKDRSKHGQNTLAKLEQVEREDFGWNVVQSWDFRR